MTVASFSAIAFAFATAFVAARSRPAATICSIATFPLARGPQITAFIGLATADTVFAGKGRVEYGIDGGHWSANRSDRLIYGQRVVVRRIAGAQVDLLDSVFAVRGDSSVVVVPWDYDPSCRPTLWGRSFMWTPANSVGVFTIELRPRQQWADNIPTFDARYAAIQPYPHGPMYVAGYHDTRVIREGGALSVPEYFDFWRSLPMVSPTGADSLQYRRVICDWAALHIREARQWPASRIVSWQRCG